MSNRIADRAPSDIPERHSVRLPGRPALGAEDRAAVEGAALVQAVLQAALGPEAARCCASWIVEALRAGGTSWHDVMTDAGVASICLTLLDDGARECHALLSIARCGSAARVAERLAAARLDAMIGTAGAVCHAVNNALTAVLGNAEMLLETEGLPADAQVSAQLILRAAERLDGLTRKTLRLGRARRPGPGRCDPHAQLTRLVRKAAPSGAEAARLELSLAPDLGTPLVDPGAFDAAIAQLLDNALAAAPPGGTVALRAEREGTPAWPGFAWLRVTVEDDGPGLPAAELAFPGGGFLAPGRSGGRQPLGLASVRAFATALGGHLEAGRSARGGARLTLRLPVQDVQAAAP
ncbi:HAMP domain-containing histidine kinase [Roseococcus sp. SDR]|uniref:sensor histidine kinase n=1 Tax=Roseococcus sp. SDR TaxID=2835532 RepID=UPI001BCF83D6|nr:HAMP domain-containing sensor histidine kinase [Roseococcus sp. SDR]MBS7789733.1 HAMP domain-containing histidine kinase [Roseococcus sp. SDR]MBV1845047.1 HAMP domain-containing histidine kinase [Roseococcus sp. SDR]